MSPKLYRILSMTLMVILTTPTLATANDGLLVKGVAVDVTAESALSARNKAFAEARRKAYEHVAAKSMTAAELETLNVPSDAVLASMVRDFEIENEKMTSRRYVGTINVRFNPTVRRAFNSRAAAPSDVAQNTLNPSTAPTTADAYTNERDYVYSPARSNTSVKPATPAMPVATQHVATAMPVLVLPWYGTRGNQTIWGEQNAWRAAWENVPAALNDPAMPIILPVGDVDDVRDYAPPQPLSERSNVNALLHRYGASDAVIALAEPAEAGAVVVSLFRIEGSRPVAMGRFGVDAGLGRDSLKQAVERTLVSLRSMPRVGGTPVQSAAMQTEVHTPYNPPILQDVMTNQQFTALARFSGLQQWVQMRNTLAATPGVQSLDIQSISPAQAQVQFSYQGDGSALASSLAQGGLQFVPITVGGSASTVAGAPAPTHQITTSPMRSF